MSKWRKKLAKETKRIGTQVENVVKPVIEAVEILAPGDVKTSGLKSDIPSKKAAAEQALNIKNHLGIFHRPLNESDLENYFKNHGIEKYLDLFDAQNQGFKDTYNAIMSSRQEEDAKLAGNSVAVTLPASPVIQNITSPTEEPVDPELLEGIEQSLKDASENDIIAPTSIEGGTDPQSQQALLNSFQNMEINNKEEDPDIIRAIKENLEANANKAAEEARKKQEEEDAKLAQDLALEEDANFARRLQGEQDNLLREEVNKQVAIAAAAEKSLGNDLSNSNLDSIANIGNNSVYNTRSNINYAEVAQELLNRIAGGEKVTAREVENAMKGASKEEIGAFGWNLVRLDRNNSLASEKVIADVVQELLNKIAGGEKVIAGEVKNAMKGPYMEESASKEEIGTFGRNLVRLDRDNSLASEKVIDELTASMMNKADKAVITNTNNLVIEASQNNINYAEVVQELLSRIAKREIVTAEEVQDRMKGAPAKVAATFATGLLEHDNYLNVDNVELLGVAQQLINDATD